MAKATVRTKLPEVRLHMTVYEGILLAVLRTLVGQGVVTEEAAAGTYWEEYERNGWSKERRGERIAG